MPGIARTPFVAEIMTDMDAMALFMENARKNTARRIRGEALQGLAFQMEPAHYPSVEPWLPEMEG